MRHEPNDATHFHSLHDDGVSFPPAFGNRANWERRLKLIEDNASDLSRWKYRKDDEAGDRDTFAARMDTGLFAVPLVAALLGVESEPPELTDDDERFDP